MKGELRCCACMCVLSICHGMGEMAQNTRNWYSQTPHNEIVFKSNSIDLCD